MKYILAGYFFCIILFVCSCNISFRDEEKVSDGDLKMLSSFCQKPMMDILSAPDPNAQAIVRIYRGDVVKLLGDSISIREGARTTNYHKVQLADNTQGWAVDDSLAIHVRTLLHSSSRFSSFVK